MGGAQSATVVHTVKKDQMVFSVNPDDEEPEQEEVKKIDEKE